MNINENAVAVFLKERLLDIEAGAYDHRVANHKLFEMIVQGAAKLPLDRVEDVAIAVDCDPRHLFRLAASQFYSEDAICLLERMLGPPVTNEEQLWLNEIRSATDGPVSAPSGMAKRLVRALAKAPA